MTAAFTVCRRCGEPVLATDKRSPATLDGRPLHWECGLRIVVGSVGHLQRRCSCYGGSDEDPEGMTKRQAAQAAAALWLQLAEDEPAWKPR